VRGTVPDGLDQADAMVAETGDDRLQHHRTGPVEPLQVVDDQQDRSSRGQSGEEIEHCVDHLGPVGYS
jgi:hypothetical protein